MLDMHVQPKDVESQSPASSVGARPNQGGLQRAVLYTPIIVLGAVFGAVGMFPDLAEHTTPLIGDSAAQCSKTSTAQHCSGKSQCPGTLRSVGISCAVDPASTGSGANHSLIKHSCCVVDSPSETAVINGTTVDGAAPSDEPPADASAAVNAIESDAASN